MVGALRIPDLRQRFTEVRAFVAIGILSTLAYAGCYGLLSLALGVPLCLTTASLSRLRLVAPLRGAASLGLEPDVPRRRRLTPRQRAWDFHPTRKDGIRRGRAA